MAGQDFLQTVAEWIFSLTVFLQTLLQIVGISPSPCGAPIQYTLGSIDKQFGISKEEVLRSVAAAEKLWEDASGKNLFEYNESSGIPVSFVYDERQQKTQATQALESKLESFNIDESAQGVQEQVRNYEQAKATYESAKTKYEEAGDAYNRRVEQMSKSGGVTQKEVDDLENQYDRLQERFQELEVLRQKANGLVGATNNQITQNKSLVKQYNKEVTTFQDLYGGDGDAFDQGVYTGKDITIYQYDDANRLVLVLAHEMGHALGIDHIENSQALMYYLMRDQDVAALALHEADKVALSALCQKPTFSSAFGIY